MLPPGIRRAFRLALRRGEDVIEETDEEIRLHIALRVEALMARGLSRERAETEALRRFGPLREGRAGMLAAAKRRHERLTMLDHLKDLWGDVRYSLAQMRRGPGFTLAVVLTFAIGIGANATMFGVIDRLLLRPPPGITDPGALYNIRATQHFGGSEIIGSAFSYPAYADFRDRVAGFTDVALQTFPNDLAIGRGETAKKVRGVMVSGNYFRALGVLPAAGRLMVAEDAQPPTGNLVVVISYGLWQREFGGSRSALGAVMDFGALQLTVIGVAPRGFTGSGNRPIDVWVPVTTFKTLGFMTFLDESWTTRRSAVWLAAVGRLKPGVSIAQVEAQATAAFRAGQAHEPGADSTSKVRLESILPLRKSELSPAMKVASLLGAVALLVLLIAGANVTNLLLARVMRRRREIGVRLALGISRSRLARQFLVESTILALFGGAAALLVAYAGGMLVRRGLLENFAWSESLLDSRLLIFTAIAAVIAGLATGLVPVLQFRSLDLSSVLRDSAPGGGVSRARTRTVLLTVQGVLSVVLLVGTGLFVRSLQNVGRIRLGLEADRVVSVVLDLQPAGFPDSAVGDVYRRLEERARSIPGIESATLGEGTPFGWSLGTSVIVPGRDSLPIPAGTGPNLVAVSDDYFRTLGTRIVQGRAFTREDVHGGARVAMISAEMARRVWPGGGAVGSCVKIGADTVPCSTIVGVSENVHQGELVEDTPTSWVYVPLDQGRQFVKARALYLRVARGPAEAMIVPIRRMINSTVANLPYPDIRVMSSNLHDELRPWKLGATMFGVFGVLALLVTAVGLYSVIAYMVGQRMRELGVRIALGATRTNILRLVLGHGLKVSLGSAALGLLIALAGGRLVRGMLYQVSPGDPVVFGVVTAVLLLVTVAASFLPALKATSADPLAALKSE